MYRGTYHIRVYCAEMPDIAPPCSTIIYVPTCIQLQNLLSNDQVSKIYTTCYQTCPLRDFTWHVIEKRAPTLD